MQQPPPAPRTVPPATATDAQAVTVILPDGPIPLSALPRTAQQVEGLRERREMLRDQLSRATNRRDDLVIELNRTGAAEARAGIQQRLNLLDARILQLERDQAATERLLSNAPPEVLALAEVPARRGGGMDEDAAAFMAFTMFGFGIFVAYLVGRWRRRRARKRGDKSLTAVSSDRRLDELTNAVHAIAEEVERIGEGQRFVTQLLASRREPVALKEEGERR